MNKNVNYVVNTLIRSNTKNETEIINLFNQKLLKVILLLENKENYEQ